MSKKLKIVLMCIAYSVLFTMFCILAGPEKATLATYIYSITYFVTYHIIFLFTLYLFVTPFVYDENFDVAIKGLLILIFFMMMYSFDSIFKLDIDKSDLRVMVESSFSYGYLFTVFILLIYGGVDDLWKKLFDENHD